MGTSVEMIDRTHGHLAPDAEEYERAESVTAIDASPEMLAIASSRIGGDRRARFVQADLFLWRPDQLYDVVFFGFWLSHVPLERFRSGRWSPSALHRTAGCSSRTMPIGRQTSSSKASLPRPFVGGSKTARRFGPSRCRTHRLISSDA
jgi:hypothetical protein